ncbi:DUF3899 domain-containing protein [Exiguobacterium sp. SL-10]|uniref:DUF3899 domain-containing protein n=1 Tax=unclassified Exiguobacterium TaxID=2644629 RepID=UPI00103934AE|nr:MULTISPECIES: DUF3899 domain-containing protein [unclassified Exiguobacterium]TCI23377.1 DUF3899 domain-containing protein [Exiguobacterium sp. SL-9]TCI31680.1 DUF3899 domain-containing protein [Exiguobacterium sp. SL-10]
MKNFRSILIVWGIVTIAYTVWSSVSYYKDETLLFHLSGGLFVAGMLVFAIGMFSQMSASGLFDGIMYGFKRNRRAKLKEIDPDYEEDEEATPEERASQKQSAWRWVYVGVGSIILSYVITFV